MFGAFLADEGGSTLLGYGVIAVVLTVAIVGAAGAVGVILDQMYSAAPADVMQVITGTVEVAKGTVRVAG